MYAPVGIFQPRIAQFKRKKTRTWEAGSSWLPYFLVGSAACSSVSASRRTAVPSASLAHRGVALASRSRVSLEARGRIFLNSEIIALISAKYSRILSDKEKDEPINQQENWDGSVRTAEHGSRCPQPDAPGR